MRAILTLEDNSRVTVPVELERTRKRKFIYAETIESDVIKKYNRWHDVKAVKAHLLRN